MAGAKNETTGAFATIARNCSIEMYAPNGTLVEELGPVNVTVNGFLQSGLGECDLFGPYQYLCVYNGITQIMTDAGGKFRTPFLMNLISTVSLYNMTLR